jgi:hypothetical protein
MADFTIRSDNVDVEQIMRQIRTRLREKRGVDYTEDDVRELAAVKLEKFLNPRAVRSELVEQYRRQRPTKAGPPPDNYAFEADTIYHSHRAPLEWIRKLLNPILKLFFNPNPLVQVLHRQGKINEYLIKRFGTRDELDDLNFEVLNNIVLEITRLSIEVKNLSMRIESMTARQEFNERRARAFEGLVSSAAPSGPAGAGADAGAGDADDATLRARRRRRRRGRRRPEEDAGTAAAAGAASKPSPDERSTGTSTAGPADKDTSPQPPGGSDPGNGQ